MASADASAVQPLALANAEGNHEETRFFFVFRGMLRAAAPGEAAISPRQDAVKISPRGPVWDGFVRFVIFAMWSPQCGNSNRAGADHAVMAIIR